MMPIMESEMNTRMSRVEGHIELGVPMAFLRNDI